MTASASNEGLAKRTPEQWCNRYGVEIRDPDGWRDQEAPEWGAPITLPEFRQRAARSTVDDLTSTAWQRVAQDAKTTAVLTALLDCDRLLSDEETALHGLLAEREELAEHAARLDAALTEMTSCRDAAVRYADRQHVPIELDDEIDIDGEILGDRIADQLSTAPWDWEDERVLRRCVADVMAVVRPHLARLTDQAQQARAALEETRRELREVQQEDQEKAGTRLEYGDGYLACRRGATSALASDTTEENQR